MKKNFIIYLLAILALGVFTVSCGDEDPVKEPITGEALFSYVADGYTVTFTNTSTVSGTVTYAWEFGDGETSTDKDPVHTYAGKGEYSVKLVVTDSEQGLHPVTTKINIDKATRINLSDNSFDDWNKVTEAEFIVPLGDNSGNIKSLIFDYDADNVYIKMSYEGALIDSMVLDVFIDTDVDKSTGFNSTLWTGSGLDILMEGTVLHGWFDLFDYSGEANGWGWTPSGETNFFTVGNVEEANGLVTFELAFDRNKVSGLNSDKVKFAMQLQMAWAGVGWAPDQFVDGSNDTDGFTLNMN